MLAAVLEEEVNAFLGRHRPGPSPPWAVTALGRHRPGPSPPWAVTALGRHRYVRGKAFRGYRNGYHPARELTVGLGSVLYLFLSGTSLAPLSEVLYLIQGAGPASNLSGFSTPSVVPFSLTAYTCP